MATPHAPAGSVSPIDAVSEAIAHTKRHLFPFQLGKWLVLGLLAFLDQLGRSSWSSGGHWGGGGDGGDDENGERAFTGFASAVESALAWLSEHLWLVLAGGAVVLLLASALVALVVWINARGTFMYLDAVASGRAQVARPWREHARAADSYFVWRFGLALAALGIVLTAAALVVAAVVGIVRGRLEWSSAGPLAVALVPVLLVLFVALPLLVLVGVALRDFVAPLQLNGGLTCGQAVSVFEGLLIAHPGAFVLYVLLKVVLAVAIGLAVLVAGCLTCCIGFLPVVCQTLLQPLFFFERAWSLCLLRQMGYDLPSRLQAQA